MKSDREARLSMPRIRKDRSDAHVRENKRLTIHELQDVSHMFRNLSSMRLSQFNTDTEKLVPNGFQERSQMNTAEEVKDTVADGLNGLAADGYGEGIVRLVQRLDKCLNSNGDYVQKRTCVVSGSGIKII
jgi:hypothetical protein